MKKQLIALAAVLALTATACGSATDIASGEPRDPAPPVPTTEHEPPVWVLPDADDVAFRHVVSGGIAGVTVSDVVIYGDGSGTITELDETRSITVPVELLNDVLLDLERAGVHDIDPDSHPNVGIADGFGTGLTVHTVNGTAGLGFYGITEVPDLFDADWVRVSDAAGEAVRTITSA